MLKLYYNLRYIIHRGQLKGLTMNQHFPLFSFRAPENENLNKILLQNIKALDGMDKFPTRLIDRKFSVKFHI